MAGITVLPVVDARFPDELVGYDDVGLPTGEFQRFCDRIGEQAQARALTAEKLSEILANDPWQ